MTMNKRYKEQLDNYFAAHHEAGHALVTELLGGKVASLGLTPTPHCIPDVEGMGDYNIAMVCMAGAAATLRYYGTMGPCETDIIAARHFAKDHLAPLDGAVKLIETNEKRFFEIVDKLIEEVGEENKYADAQICVDTVNAVLNNGPQLINTHQKTETDHDYR